MEKKFTIEQFRNYLLKQDSFGDVLYNLKSEKIEEANEPEEESNEPYCIECGRDEEFVYHRTVANGDEYYCENCKIYSMQ